MWVSCGGLGSGKDHDYLQLHLMVATKQIPYEDRLTALSGPSFHTLLLLYAADLKE